MPNTRYREHESNIKNLTYKPVTNHCASYNHAMEDYMISSVDKERDTNKRLRSEKVWMILLDTLSHRGLNSRW